MSKLPLVPMDQFHNAHKRKKLLELLDRGLVMLHLDPRAEGVVVPPQFTGQAALRLNIAYGFNLPALDIGPDGVYAVLSFNRQNFGCTIPWHAIFGASLPQDSHDGVIWPSSLPPELDEPAMQASLAAVRDEQVPPPAPAPAAAGQIPLDPTQPVGPGTPGRPGFRVVRASAAEEAPPEEDRSDPQAGPEDGPARPVLRIVRD